MWQPGMPKAPGLASVRLRSAGVDREGVNAARHQGVQGIIYEAMPADAAEAFEPGAGDGDAEVPPLAGTGMADVEMAVVDDRQRLRSERLAQDGVDLFGRDAHRESGPALAAGRVPGASAGGSSSLR